MNHPADKSGRKYTDAISQSGLTIYDPIKTGNIALWIPDPQLERILSDRLRNISLSGLPLRTRSKVAKEHVCRALGYPVPSAFKKTKPKAQFPGQDFDVYVQKSDNLQIWNEELVPTRRYVIIRVTGKDQIDRVRVVTGARLSLLDTTGTLTQKYQARLVSGKATAELITPYDTENLAPLVYPGAEQHIRSASPVSYPTDKFLIPIRILFEKLTPLLGSKFSCTGSDQERLRGAELHRRVCQQIGYTNYQDDGRFPDIRHQLLEVKLQTSPTIDLGLVCPNSQNILDVPEIQGRQIRHCDVRYAVFCGQSDGGQIMLTHLYVTTGEAFISRFPQFQGKVLNKKRQLRLPADFFGR